MCPCGCSHRSSRQFRARRSVQCYFKRVTYFRQRSLKREFSEPLSKIRKGNKKEKKYFHVCVPIKVTTPSFSMTKKKITSLELTVLPSRSFWSTGSPRGRLAECYAHKQIFSCSDSGGSSIAVVHSVPSPDYSKVSQCHVWNGSDSWLASRSWPLVCSCCE